MSLTIDSSASAHTMPGWRSAGRIRRSPKAIVNRSRNATSGGPSCRPEAGYAKWPPPATIPSVTIIVLSWSAMYGMSPTTRTAVATSATVCDFWYRSARTSGRLVTRCAFLSRTSFRTIHHQPAAQSVGPRYTVRNKSPWRAANPTLP